MRQSIRRPSAALVVACLALLVALGGTSYATVLNVPRNSVGPPQLKRNAVGPSKVAPNAIRSGHVLNGSLLVADFKPGQIPQGPKGDKGDTGSPGVAGLEVVTAESATNSDTLKSASVACPAGKRVLGGGARAAGQGGASTPAGVALLESYTSGTSWFGSGREINATGSNWRVVVQAVCATVAS